MHLSIKSAVWTNKFQIPVGGIQECLTYRFYYFTADPENHEKFTQSKFNIFLYILINYSRGTVNSQSVILSIHNRRVSLNQKPGRLGQLQLKTTRTNKNE